MSHTNETLHYGLSQYVGSDILNPLTDMNGDNQKIDEALYDANSNAASAKTTAENAASTVGSFDDRITALEQGESGGEARISKTQRMIAPDFDPLKAGGYAVGDKVNYQDKLYKFKNTHIGAWSNADVDEVNVVELIGEGGGSGDLDARVTQCETDIDTLEGSVATLQNNVASVQSEVGTLDGSVTTLQNEVVNINGDIADIQSQLGTTQRRFIVISDSYGMGRGGATPWTTTLQELIEATAANYFTYSEGSMGFAKVGDSGHTAKTLLEAHASDITDAQTITDIVFGLGINDYDQTATAINNAVTALVTYCRETYPKATIWFGFIGNNKNKVNESGMNNGIMKAYLSCNSAFLGKGCKVMEGIEYICRNCLNLLSDNVHPTTAGGTLIAQFARDCLAGGHPIYKYSGTCGFTGAMANATASIMINGDITSITLPYTFYTASAVSITSRVARIGVMSNPVVRPAIYATGSAYGYVDNAFAPLHILVRDTNIDVNVDGTSIPANVALSLPTITIPTILC